jgi:hypothetical protein
MNGVEVVSLRHRPRSDPQRYRLFLSKVLLSVSGCVPRLGGPEELGKLMQLNYLV